MEALQLTQLKEKGDGGLGVWCGRVLALHAKREDALALMREEEGNAALDEQPATAKHACTEACKQVEVDGMFACVLTGSVHVCSSTSRVACERAIEERDTIVCPISGYCTSLDLAESAQTGGYFDAALPAAAPRLTEGRTNQQVAPCADPAPRLAMFGGRANARQRETLDGDKQEKKRRASVAKLERDAEQIVNLLLFSSRRAELNEKHAEQMRARMDAFQKRAIAAIKGSGGGTLPVPLQTLAGAFSAAFREAGDVLVKHNPDFTGADAAWRAQIVRELVRRSIVTWAAVVAHGEVATTVEAKEADHQQKKKRKRVETREEEEQQAKPSVTTKKGNAKRKPGYNFDTHVRIVAYRSAKGVRRSNARPLTQEQLAQLKDEADRACAQRWVLAPVPGLDRALPGLKDLPKWFNYESRAYSKGESIFLNALVTQSRVYPRLFARVVSSQMHQ